jgi:hypothetical protein
LEGREGGKGRRWRSQLRKLNNMTALLEEEHERLEAVYPQVRNRFDGRLAVELMTPLPLLCSLHAQHRLLCVVMDSSAALNYAEMGLMGHT